jgi:nitrite reductase (NADH) small subunit
LDDSVDNPDAATDASDRSASGGSGHERPAWPGNAMASWLDVGDIADVVKRKKFVVGEGLEAKVVIVHDNCVYALDNVCIHKQRELVRGVVLGDRIVCPGHQWAFQLATGFEAKMEQHQPTYPVRISDDGRVEVDVASPSAARPVQPESDVG